MPRAAASWTAGFAAALYLSGCALDRNGLGAELGPADSGPGGPDDSTFISDVHQPSDALGEGASPDATSASADDASVDAVSDAFGNLGDAFGEASGDAPVEGASPPDGALCTPGTAGCIVVPDGWSAVAYAPNGGTDCPSGFGSGVAVTSDPDFTNACTCGDCSVTTPPTCGATVTVTAGLDTAGANGPPTCNATPLVLAADPGVCTALPAFPPIVLDVQIAPPNETDGMCTSPGKPDVSAVTFGSHGTLCTLETVATACAGTLCSAAVPAPFDLCVAAQGNFGCPTGLLSVAHVVGNDVSFNCSDCGCAVTANCAGKLVLYSDGTCSTMTSSVAADNTCTRLASSQQSPASSVKFAPDSTTATCQTSGPSFARNAAFGSGWTVCCGD